MYTTFGTQFENKHVYDLGGGADAPAARAARAKGTRKPPKRKISTRGPCDGRTCSEAPVKERRDAQRRGFSSWRERVNGRKNFCFRVKSVEQLFQSSQGGVSGVY